jgi:hypothetical protein
MTGRIVFLLRRAHTEDWTARNPVLREGEFGQDKDNGQLKVGDGVTPWSDLDRYYPTDDEIQLMIQAATGGEVIVGDLEGLTTTDKSTVVAAINEINTPPVNLAVLYNNAKAG